MAYLLDLADACRRSGLKVVEVDGWKTRGHGPMASAETIVCHHTATSDKAAGDYPTMRVVRDGRPGLPGPLAQIGLGRSGTVYVIAAGRCYHAGKTQYRRQGNSYAIGIECEASGASAVKGVQLDAYYRLVRALADHYKVSIDRVESHGEIAVPRGRKNDVRNDMASFRSGVVAVGLSNGGKAVTKTGGKYLTITGKLNAGTVKKLQAWVGSSADGVIGPNTIKALQRKIGVSADGDFGPKSARALEKFLGLKAEKVPGWYPGLIRGLQTYLNDRIKEGSI